MDRKYISLCFNEPSNVIYSQVVEYLKALETHGLCFDLYFLLSGRFYIKKWQGSLDGAIKVRDSISGKVKYLPSPLVHRPSGVGWAILLMYLNLFPPRKDRIIVMHARNITSAYIAAKLKQIRPDIRYVFDVRGDKISEFEYLAKSKNYPDETVKKAIDLISSRERYAAELSDHIFCVSSVLKNILIERNDIKEEKISVIPCCAESSRFTFNNVTREQVRKKLEIEGKFVFIYSGGIAKWHCSDKIFELMGELLNLLEDTFFIALTPNVDKANILAAKHLPKGKFSINSAKPEEVPGYLMASDMGVLLRERDPLNEVASPTKFAEYLVSGLPVLMSDNIGDYSQFLKEHRVGVIVDNNGKKSEVCNEIIKYLQRNNKKTRREISDLALRNFSKAQHIALMKDIYLNL